MCRHGSQWVAPCQLTTWPVADTPATGDHEMVHRVSCISGYTPSHAAAGGILVGTKPQAVCHISQRHTCGVHTARYCTTLDCHLLFLLRASPFGYIKTPGVVGVDHHMGAFPPLQWSSEWSPTPTTKTRQRMLVAMHHDKATVHPLSCC